MPLNAVQGGQDRDGGKIYVGRANYQGDLLPAKICPRHGCAFVSWNGKEHRMHTYEALRSTNVAWKQGSGGQVPPKAICVGQTSRGEFLYVGRTFHNGNLTVGKIHPSHGVLYIPFNGMELSFPRYEVLVLL